MSGTRDRLGRTALHIAAASGATDVVRALVRAGHPLRLHSYGGRQPLHEAAHAGHAGAVSAILDGRADPMAKTEEPSGIAALQTLPPAGGGMRRGGQTAQELAAARGHAEVVALLAGHVRSAAAPSTSTAAAQQRALGRATSAPSFPR
mmetsp:Transcript_43798/g.127516  ORF Transcript_43798/g.127516 Transcript_43798/m.127516 type:complete len:148 (-) Transcript_43798:12-455(-)